MADNTAGGDAVELDNLVIRMLLENSDYIDGLKEATERAKSASSDIVQSFQRQIDTFGMTSREVAIYNAQMSGASEEQIRQAKQLDAELTAMAEHKIRAAETARDSVLASAAAEKESHDQAMQAEKEQAAVTAQAEADRLALLNQGAAVTRSLETDQERRLRQTEDLNKLLREGAISQETYTRAMERFRVETINTSEAISTLSSTMVRTFVSLGVAGSVQGLFNQFSKVEGTMLSLGASIENSGNSVKETLGHYREFAIEMDRVSSSSKGQVISLLQQASAMGLVGDKAERAVKNALTLGAMRQQDASSFIRQTSMLEQGKMPHRFAMMLGMGEDTDDEDKQEKVADAKRRLAKNFNLVEASAQTSSVQVIKLGQSLAALGVEVGGVIASAVGPLVKVAMAAVEAFNSMDASVRATAINIAVASAGFYALYRSLGFVLMTVIKLGPALVTTFSASPLGAWILAIGAAVAAVGFLKDAIGEASTAFGQMDTALKNNKDILDKIASEKKEKTRQFLAGIEGDSDKDQLDKIIKERDKVDKLRNAVDLKLEAARKRSQLPSGETPGLDPDFMDVVENRLKSWFKPLEEMILPGVKAERLKEVTAFEAELKSLVAQWHELQDAANRFTGNDAIVKARTELDITIAHMKDAVSTVGMSEGMKKAFGMSTESEAPGKKGVAKLDLGELIDIVMLDEVKKAAEESEKLEADSRKLNQTLRDQITTFGDTTHQIELYKLEQRGLGEEAIALKQRLQEQIEVLDKQKERMTKGEHVMHDVLTPQEKFAEKQAELSDLVENGAIGFEVYGKAVEKARSSLLGAKDAANAFHSAASGSAEAISRIESYRDRMREISMSKAREVQFAQEARAKFGDNGKSVTIQLGDAEGSPGFTGPSGVAEAAEKASIGLTENALLLREFNDSMEISTDRFKDLNISLADLLGFNDDEELVAAVAGRKEEEDKSVTLLGKIVEGIGKLVDKDPVELEGANL